MNGYNMNNVRCEGGRIFRNKKREYQKDDLETDGKNKRIRNLYRVINEFNKGYQPRTYLVLKDENGVVLEESHSILNVHGVSDDKHTKLCH
jgi:hypothetical protein